MNKEYIYNQHQVISTDLNDKIDNFETYISDLHIGNPDDEINQYRALQDKYDKLYVNCIELEEKLDPKLYTINTPLSEIYDDIQETTPTPTAYQNFASPSISAMSGISSSNIPNNSTQNYDL